MYFSFNGTMSGQIVLLYELHQIYNLHLWKEEKGNCSGSRGRKGVDGLGI